MPQTQATTQWVQSDAARREIAQRTLTVSGEGSVLSQPFINRMVQLLTLRELGIQSTLPHKPGQGPAAYINRRTAGTTGGAWVADTGTATEETGSWAQTSFAYRTLLTKATLTRALIAKGKSYADLLVEELTGKSEDFANAFESGLAIGDNAADANQISGLLTLINAVSGQVVANTSASAGDTLTIAKLDAAIRKVRGFGNRADLRIYCSLAGHGAIEAALQSLQRFPETVNVAAGFEVISYKGIPVIPSTAIPDTLTWSGTSITDLANGATTAIVVVNSRHVWIEDLTPTTVMPLAQSTSQNVPMEIYTDTALVYANTLGGAIVGGVPPST